MTAMRAALVVLIASWLALVPASAEAVGTPGCGKATPTSWNQTETWIWRKLCAGEVANLNTDPQFGARPVMSDVASWSARRTVRASFLEAVVTSRTLAAVLDSQRIIIRGARYTEPVSLPEVHVTISIYLTQSRFEKTVDLTGAAFDKSLWFTDSYFADTIRGDSLTVEGGLHLERAHVETLDLTYASIGKHVALSDATISTHLLMGGATVGGNVALTNENAGSFQATDLSYARIGGSLLAMGGRFGGAPDLRSAQIGENLFATGAHLPNGLVLSQANVVGFVQLSKAELEMVRAHGTTIGGTLILADSLESPRWEKDGYLDLRGATVGSIDDNETAWPPFVLLGGFRYELTPGDQVTVDRGSGGTEFARQTVGWYKDWLARDPSHPRSSYQQLEASLRSLGRNGDADKIAIFGKDQECQFSTCKSRFALSTLYRYTVGYGYEPQRAIYWALPFIGFGWILAAARLPASPTAPSALILSIQRFIPFLSFGDAYNKVDTTSADVDPWVRRYFYLHAIVGYVLAAFLVAALSQLTNV